MKDITFVGNARCYHSMDWFRTVRSLSPTDRNINFLTDLIDSERHAVLVRSDDNVGNLYNIDWLLFRQQSRLSDAWRNVVKLLLSPVQVILLRRYVNKHPGRLYHAHTMYYMFVCAMAGVPFIGTPQGSEVLVRSQPVPAVGKHIPVIERTMRRQPGMHRAAIDEAVAIARDCPRAGTNMNERVRVHGAPTTFIAACAISARTQMKPPSHARLRRTWMPPR